MWENFDLIKMIGGLGMFLFGMYLMEEAIKKLSGGSLRKIIRKYTSGTLRSISVGMLATTALQSSSALSLIVLAFVGAGVINMQNAIGLILGANIGSTTTGWIVALIGFKFNIENFALPMIGIGGLFTVLFANRDSTSKVFQIISGAGMLFLGLSFMKSSVEMLAENIDVSQIPNYGLILYFLIGIASTALMQASSATVAIVLTALHAGLISFNSAAAMVIGADVGTTVTILIGAIGGGAVKKRVAYAQVGFNLITGIAALIILPLLIWLISIVIDIDKSPIEALVMFHTFFNLLGVLVFVPIIKPFSKLLEKLVREHKTNSAKYINKASAEMIDTALLALKNEIIHLFRHIMFFNLKVLEIDEKLIFENEGPSQEEKRLGLMKDYEKIKQLQSEILTYAAGIQMKVLSKDELFELERLLHGLRLMVHAAKTIKDIKHNLVEFDNEDNSFLNNQYAHFRKRMTETYLEISRILNESALKVAESEEILSLLDRVKKADKTFLGQTIEAINNKEIQDLGISNIIVANRAFVQSCRQLLLAMREIVLTKEELLKFDELQEDKDEYLEIEDR